MLTALFVVWFVVLALATIAGTVMMPVSVAVLLWYVYWAPDELAPPKDHQESREEEQQADARRDEQDARHAIAREYPDTRSRGSAAPRSAAG